MPELNPLRFLIKCAGYVSLILIANPLGAQTSVTPPPLPSPQGIIDRMMARNAWQDQMLLEFSASRQFYAANLRFKTDATMLVQTLVRRPDQVQSTVKSSQASAC